MLCRAGIKLLFAIFVSTGPLFAADAPHVTIVVGDKAPPLEKFAADELTQQFQKLWSAKITLATSVPKTGPAILIGSPGSNPAVKYLVGENWPKLSEQGFVIRSTDAHLVIGGNTPVATLWATYELGHQFGVRYTLYAGDVYPAETPEFKLTGFDLVSEPNLEVRSWRSVFHSAISPEAYSLAEHQRVLQQLAKLKFNRITLAIDSSQPFVNFEFEGIKKETAVLWFGHKFPIDGDTAGRSIFKGAKEFTNPDFVGKKTPAEMLKAGHDLLQGVIDEAHQLGMSVIITYSPLEFPREFQAKLPRAATVAQTDELLIGPGENWKWDEPASQKLAAAQLNGILKAYPDTHLSLTFSPTLLDNLSESARGKVNLPTDDFQLETLTGTVRPVDKKFKQRQVSAYVDTANGSLLSGMPVLQIHSAGSERRSVEIISLIDSDLDPYVYYLSRNHWNKSITAEQAYEDLVRPSCGEGVGERLIVGWTDVAKAGALISSNAPDFASPGPDLVLQHYTTTEPAHAWWQQVADLYLSGMNESYRAHDRSDPKGRKLLYNFCRRYEFNLEYVTAMQAVRAAAVAREQKDTDTQIAKLEAAMESLYNGLTALSTVAADDPNYQGVIAIVTEYGYRALQKEVERLQDAAAE